jgi:hypothetical protein
MIGVELPTAANQPCLSRRHKRAARHVHRIKLDLTFRRDQAVELCVAEEPLPVVPIPILTHPMIFPRRAEIVRKATAHPCGDAFAAQKGAQQECEIAAGSDCSFTGWPWDLEGSPVLFENVVQPLGNRQRGARDGAITSDPGHIRVRLGTLSQNATATITGHVWVRSKPDWYSIQDGLPQYEQSATAVTSSR